MQISHPSDSRLVFEAELLPEYKQTFDKYSPIDPPEKERYEITAVSFCGTDVTDFVTDYCDKLLPEWEDAIVENGLDS